MVELKSTDTGLKSTFDPITVEITLGSGEKQKVVVRHKDADAPLFANKFGFGWWDVQSQYGAVANDVAGKLEDLPTGEEYWREKWSELCTQLTEKADEAESEALPRSAEAKRIVENTKKVVVAPGETTEWEVVIEENGRTGTLKFTHSEVSQRSPDALREEYSRVFYRTPPIEENDEWEDIRTAWQNMQVERPAVDFTDDDMVVETFVAKLKEELKVVSDPVDVAKGESAAWYDENNNRGVGTHDGSVVWVKRETVQRIRDKLTDSIKASKLSKLLLTRGFTVTTSKSRQLEGVKTRFWFFDAEELGIDEMDVIEESAEERQVTAE